MDGTMVQLVPMWDSRLGEATASRRATYPFDDTPCPISAGLTEEQAQQSDVGLKAGV